VLSVNAPHFAWQRWWGGPEGDEGGGEHDRAELLEIVTQTGVDVRVSESGGGVEGREDDAARLRERTAVLSGDLHVRTELFEREPADDEHDRGLRVGELEAEVRVAGVHLDGRRVTVERWPAGDDVADEHLAARDAGVLAEETGEKLAGPSHERPAFAVLL
jgi:hypothetical protein